MPLLGKRKYINKKIEELITKLDIMGYDTTDIKKRYYDIEEEDDNEEYSAGSILPYRSKINDVLNMIENLINPHDNYYQQSNQNDYSTFKDNLINTVKNDIYQRQQSNNYQQSNQPKNNSFSLF